MFFDVEGIGDGSGVFFIFYCRCVFASTLGTTKCFASSGSEEWKEAAPC